MANRLILVFLALFLSATPAVSALTDYCTYPDTPDTFSEVHRRYIVTAQDWNKAQCILDALQDGASPGGGYTTVAEEGTNLTQRTTLNFIGSGMTCVDNSGTSSTDCTLSVSGVSDGDKGDITVSGSGATWTVDSGAVAFSELSGSATDSQVSNTITVDISTGSVTGGTASKCARFNSSGNLIAASGDCVSGNTDTDTTCNDVGVSCLFAGSASEGGGAAQVNISTLVGSGTWYIPLVANSGDQTIYRDIGGPYFDSATHELSVLQIDAGAYNGIEDADIPNDITINTATNADNLTLDPSDCSPGNVATGIDRQADLTCTADDDQPDSDAEVPNGITVDLSASGAVTGGTVTKCARFNESGNLVAASGDCSSGDTDTGITQAYQTVQEEGTGLTQRSTLNFVGGSINCADDTTKTTCTFTDDDAPECADLPTFTGDVTNTNCAMTIPANAVAFSELSGTATDAQIPDSITINNATNADAVDIAAESTDTTSFPVICDSAGSGSSQTCRTDNGLTYNASTNVLTATTFTGALSGNATTSSALAADPADCSAGTAAVGIVAAGTATCSQAGVVSSASDFWTTGDKTGPTGTSYVSLFSSTLDEAAVTTGWYRIEIELLFLRTSGSATSAFPQFRLLATDTTVSNYGIFWQSWSSTSSSVATTNDFAEDFSGAYRIGNAGAPSDIQLAAATSDNTSSVKAHIRIYLYTTGTGTLTPQIAMNTSGGTNYTTSIVYGSYWTVTPETNSVWGIIQ